MVQIPDQQSKTNAAAPDMVLIRDVSSGTDKRTTVAGLATGLFKTSVDSNGWTVLENGIWKEYEKKFTGGSVGGSGSGPVNFALAGLDMPAGVSPSMGKWTVSPIASANASQAVIVPEMDTSSIALNYSWACHAYRFTGAAAVPFTVVVRGRV